MLCGTQHAGVVGLRLQRCDRGSTMPEDVGPDPIHSSEAAIQREESDARRR